MAGELINKMERYNTIRDDDAMDEDQKEAVLEELFEGDLNRSVQVMDRSSPAFRLGTRRTDVRGRASRFPG